MEYYLKNNLGHKWFCTEKIRVKGFFFDSDGVLYSENRALLHLQEIKTLNDFLSFIKIINGVFTILIELEDRLVISTDTTRVFPVFYTNIEDKLFVSDSVEYLMNKLKIRTADESASQEFLTSGFVLGDKTLVRGINQIISDEYLVFDKGDIEKRGFRFSYSTTKQDLFSSDDYNYLYNKTTEVFENAFERLLVSVEGKQVVLPLSGGYDSRLIAVMLKKHGIDNVICYTYGKENNFELNNSEKVANELGFDWIFVPYNEKIFDNYLEGEEFDEYKDYAGKFSSMPFLQEYFAIRYLRDEKIIPHDSVIISGYAGDFLGGSQAVKVYSDKETDESMLNLLSNKLNIYNKNEKVNFDLIMSDVKHSLNLFSTTSESIIYTTIEDYLVKERLSKFIFNAASIYTFFGYEHRFPFWDMELLNHFKSVPYEFKKGKRLYDDVLKNYFFEPYNVNFKEEIQASVFDLIKKKVKDKIKIVLPYSVKVKLLNNYDWIDSKGATYPMLMDLQSNGIVFKDDTVGYNSRIIQWYLWKCKQAIEQKNNETI